MNLVLIGPSGAGKGTQAEKLAAQFGMQHIATGNLFREDLENQTALGLLAKKYMDQGELVPDEVADAMVEAALRRTSLDKGVILDGFPRTLYQAEALDELLKTIGRTLDAVIYINVPDAVTVMDRIPGRLTCKRCQRPFHEKHNPFQGCPDGHCAGEFLYRREDDTSEQTLNRLKLFHRQIAPVVEYYHQTGKLIIIDGHNTIDQVTAALTGVMNTVGKHAALRATREETREIQALKEAYSPLTSEQPTYPSLDIVLLGAPGSGKGTQAQQLCHQLNLTHIATGDLFRENLKNETELGQLAKTFMDRGELVPDDITEAMVRERLARPDTRHGFVLDGFPRTAPQAEALTDILNGLDRRLDAVIYFRVSDEEIVSRLSGRLICRECQVPFHKIHNPFQNCPYSKCHGEYLYQRDDDKEETIRARLKTFQRQTVPLIDYYKAAGLLIEIMGEGELWEVTARVLTTAEELLQQGVNS
jgi:adenylate kinase